MGKRVVTGGRLRQKMRGKVTKKVDIIKEYEKIIHHIKKEVKERRGSKSRITKKNDDEEIEKEEEKA